MDEQTTKILEQRGMGLDTVPPAGEFVQLKLTGNMSTGGTSIDCTDIAHPDNIEIAREAARVIGLDVAGIDFITPDIAQPVHEVGGAIVEVNAGPGFRMHTHPTEGHPRDVGRAVIDALFARGETGRVPIIAVTGTNGKTTTARMIAHIMKTSGKRVGLTTTDGIYVNGTQIAAGDMSGPQSAQMILKNPMIDYAVLETARGGILRRGLGFDHCNIAVVTNVTSDHLGLRGVQTVEELARVKAVVPESVFPDGCSVLSADNKWTVGMADDARGEVIFFGMDEQSPTIRGHLQQRGRAVVLRQTPQGEVIVLIDRKRETTLLRVDEIPATMGGVIRANVANALAASAAAFVDDVPLDDIRQALRTFTTDFGQTPGRFNLLEIAGRQVLIDYCHNVGALEAMADFVRRMGAPHSIGMITVPGDRRDEDVRAFGALSARIFDGLVLRDNNSLRGRKPGEMPTLLKEVVTEAGMPEERITVVWGEIEASWAAVERAAPGDLVVLMVDHPTEVWKALTRNTSRQSAQMPNGDGRAAMIARTAVMPDGASTQAPDGHQQEIIGDRHAPEMARTDALDT